MRNLAFASLLLCSSVLPASVSAQEEARVIHGEWSNPLHETEPVLPDGSMKFQAAATDPSVEVLSSALEAALLQRKTNFTVDYSGDFDGVIEKAQQAFQSVLLKHEYLNYDLQGYRFSARGFDGNIKLTFNVNYYQTAEQVAFVDQRIQQILDEIIKDGMNDHEKVKAIHDYIVLNVEYDTTSDQGVNAPYFALTEGKTLCNGYAMLMYDMLTEVGIPVRLISGEADGIGHAWNLVQLDGKWYHLDATWDDPIPDKAGRVLYNYYLVSDEMIDDDHLWQAGGLNGYERPYPTANADYADALFKLGYDQLAKSLDLHYLSSEFTSQTDEEFVHLVSSQFDKMAEEFSLRFIIKADNIKEKLDGLIQTAARQTGATSWRYNWAEYSRTEANDYIVTIADIQYSKEVLGLEMLRLPDKALEQGEQILLIVAAKLSNGTEMDVTDQAVFTVADPTIASVENGYLTAKNAGSTIVNVSFQGKQTSFSIDVKEEREEITYPMNGYKHFGEQSNVDPNKIWTIIFNNDIKNNFSDSQIYVVNRFGEKSNQLIKLENSKTLKIYPPTGGYTKGENYYLVIEKSLQSIKDKNLKEAITYKFTIR
ncbi:transglutaminase domain-containing protein [Bacillus sp. FJAT-42315]|uniref:transglutaminase domain-containing protein n=1 Tax=Bacillus sp. FJAT-42315 TaxID=2014077 RepID=UPI000C238858|nr:transglutaminase domain-containing protein [Bacillus sp. FJAT-42315]